MQEPIQIKLGERMILQRRVSQPYLKIVNDCIYYIPFLESLHRLLSDNLVFEEVNIPSLIVLSNECVNHVLGCNFCEVEGRLCHTVDPP